MKYLLLSSFLVLSALALTAQEKEYRLDKEYSISKNGTLNLSTDDANIVIEGTNRNNVSVDITRKVDVKGISWGDEDFKIEVEERNGDLYIRERNNSSVNISIGYYSEEYEVILKVPQTVSLNLEGDDDDYELVNIGGSITIEADDSDVTLEGCSGDDFYFELDDGDLEMDQGRGRLELDIDDGDAYIKSANFTEIDVNMDDGEVNIETSLDDSGEYYFRSSDGRIYLTITRGGGEFDISHDDGYIRADDIFEYLKKDDDRSVLKLPNGNARVRIASDDARITLKRIL